MFRHVVLFRWKEGTAEADIQAVRASLMTLPSLIPELRGYQAGPDAGLVDGNWEFAAVADFDDVDGWRVYTDHPEHQRILRDQIRPLLAERAAVQIQL